MGVLELILQENSSLDSSYSWFIAICGCFYLCFNVGYAMASGVIFVLIQERYDVTKQAASYPINTFVILASLFSCLSGPICHRLKTRKTLILGTVIGMIGSCLSVFNPLNDPVTWLSVCMGIRGIGSSLTFPPIFQVISTHFKKHQAKAFLILSTNSILAGLILPSIVVGSAKMYGLEPSWLIQGALYCQSIPFALMIRPRREIERPTNKDRDSIPEQELNSFLEGKQTELPDIHVEKAESLKTILFNLLRDKNFYALSVIYNIAIMTNIAFRTTIVDYGIDNNMEPNLNKYILEVIAFADLVRIPSSLLIDAKLCYFETLMLLATMLMALTIFLLTLTSDAVYVIVAWVFSASYAIFGTSLLPGLVTFGTSRIAVSLGFATATLTATQFCLPFLIGLSRDTYGSYDYLYYLFAIVNLLVTLLFCWIRKNDWFKHRK